jgi:hypothetical protein
MGERGAGPAGLDCFVDRSPGFAFATGGANMTAPIAETHIYAFSRMGRPSAVN